MSYLIDTPQERHKMLLLVLYFVLALMAYELIAQFYVEKPLQEQVIAIVVVIVLILLIQKKRK